MTSLALSRRNGALSGIGSPPAGDAGLEVLRMARIAVDGLKAGIAARSSFPFNDLHALAEEAGSASRQSSLFPLAQRFLLALPGGVPAPELALDDDGEVSFDWRGVGGRLLTVTLREDGRLAYASRISAYDKDHGIKRFDDAIPKRIVELVHQVTSP